MKRGLVLILALLLGACATPARWEWQRPGGTAELLRQDKTACRAQAAPDTAEMAVGPPVTAGATADRVDFFRNCIVTRGWLPLPI